MPEPTPIGDLADPENWPAAAAAWAGEQGAEWARRNPTTVWELDVAYRSWFGVTRSAVNKWALEGIPRNARILEVGCSRGVQLDALVALGFYALEGCDVCAWAVDLCGWPSRVADGCALPYEDGAFDLAMTSGTYIHVLPTQKESFLRECERVAPRWLYVVEPSMPELRVYDFGSLIPPAWMEPLPQGILSFLPGWRVVRLRVLDRMSEQGGFPLTAFLLERSPVAGLNTPVVVADVWSESAYTTIPRRS